MRIERAGWPLDVIDDPATRVWSFWEDQFATGTWEPATLDMIDKLSPNAAYLDIGAWVGPTALWAARRAGQVIAVEADPVAGDVLEANVAANPGLAPITVIRKAVAPADRQWPQILSSPPGGQLGDSCTSVLHHYGTSVVVEPVTVTELIAAADLPIGLVKVDIEGAEGLVFPDAVKPLRALRCPIILSVHLPWIGHLDRNDLYAAINRFRSVVLDDTNPHFPVFALYPR